MLRSYLGGYQRGEINPRPNISVVRETAATASVDSDRGLGTIVTPKAMDIAIQKAKEVGVGMVTIGNSRHLGMASYHAMLALEHDMIGVCMTSAPPRMVPTFGAEPRLGTNPIAVAVPARNEPPIVFDAATSSVAQNKIEIARRLGADLEPGWLAADDGTPIMEEVPVPETYHLLPVGATRELGSHKGYGLACVVDILAGVLTGFGYGAVPGRPNFGHYVAAYNVAGFDDPDHFKDEMDGWLQRMKSTKPAPVSRPRAGSRPTRGRNGSRPPQGGHPLAPRRGSIHQGHLRGTFGALRVLGKIQTSSFFPDGGRLGCG